MPVPGTRNNESWYNAGRGGRCPVIRVWSCRFPTALEPVALGRRASSHPSQLLGAGGDCAPEPVFRPKTFGAENKPLIDAHER
jgi:hypothetical protein